MGIFLAHKRKFIFALSCALLLSVYILSVWFRVKNVLKHDDGEDTICSKELTKTFSNNTLSKEFEAYSEIMSERRRYLQKQCVSSEISAKNQPKLFISKKLNFLHCGFYNSKAESLLPVQAYGNPFPHNDDGGSLLKECFSGNFITALYVQHPLESLLGLYQDKKLLSYYFTPRHSQLTASFHKNSSALFPTFTSFLRMVLTTTLPSFSMGFISDHCQLCKVDYDVIILPESRLKDLKYLFQTLNLPLDEKALKAFMTKSDQFSQDAEKLLQDPTMKNLTTKLELFYQKEFTLFKWKRHS